MLGLGHDRVREPRCAQLQHLDNQPYFCLVIIMLLYSPSSPCKKSRKTTPRATWLRGQGLIVHLTRHLKKATARIDISATFVSRPVFAWHLTIFHDKSTAGARQGRSICWELSGFYPIRRGEEVSGNGRFLLQILVACQAGRQISPRIVNLGATHDDTKPVRLGSFAFLPLLACIAGTGLDIGHEMTGYITCRAKIHGCPRSRETGLSVCPHLRPSSGHQHMDDMALSAIIDARSCSTIIFQFSVLETPHSCTLDPV